MTTDTFMDPIESTETATIERVYTSCGSKVVDVTINGDRVTLNVPKGTRGVKVGASLNVRIERRDWYEMTRMSINLREGGTTTTKERGMYRNGCVTAHYYFDCIA